MKTYTQLFDQIASFPNLWQSFQQARRGKRSKAEVARFDYQLERELRDGSYTPGGYRHFYIFERAKPSAPSGGAT